MVDALARLPVSWGHCVCRRVRMQLVSYNLAYFTCSFTAHSHCFACNISWFFISGAPIWCAGRSASGWPPQEKLQAGVLSAIVVAKCGSGILWLRRFSSSMMLKHGCVVVALYCFALNPFLVLFPSTTLLYALNEPKSNENHSPKSFPSGSCSVLLLFAFLGASPLSAFHVVGRPFAVCAARGRAF